MAPETKPDKTVKSVFHLQSACASRQLSFH